MLWLVLGPPGFTMFTCWISFAPISSFFLLLSPYLSCLCFISFLYLDLNVLDDYALII